jgi:hypothetical protein
VEPPVPVRRQLARVLQGSRGSRVSAGGRREPGARGLGFRGSVP